MQFRSIRISPNHGQDIVARVLDGSPRHCLEGIENRVVHIAIAYLGNVKA